MAGKLKKRKEKQTTVIALMGLSSGVGTTHLAVMIGMYLANGRRCKTAIVEYGQHEYYEQIKEYEKSKRVRLSTLAANKNAFSSHGIDFYEGVHNAGMIGMLKDGYDYILVDMKLDEQLRFSTQKLGELLQADRRIAVMSMSSWKLKECMMRLERIRRTALDKQLKLVSLTGSSRLRKRLKKRDCKAVMLIPWEPDPFHLKSENLQWLQRLIEE